MSKEVKKKRKKTHKGKGGEFERTICKTLSGWWSPGRDDIFWRSSNSGGRATIRGQKGKSTFGHYGDVSAVDPIGSPLLDIAAIEIKRGYSDADFHALIDRNRTAAQQVWEQWIQQACTSREQSGSYGWMIIARRNNRDTIVVIDGLLAEALNGYQREKPWPLFQLSCKVRFKEGKDYDVRRVRLVGMRFETFLKVFSPQTFIKLTRKV